MIFFSGNNSLLACIKYLNYVWDASGAAPLDDGAGSWNSSGGTNWALGSTFGSWSNNNIAIFGANNGTAGTITVGTVSANGLIFRSATSGNYTLSGGTITLNGNRPTINNFVDSTINSIFAGSNGLYKNGTGVLILGGTNTYTGPTSINLGTLRVTGTGNIPSSSNISISSGAILDFNVAGTFSNNISGTGIIRRTTTSASGTILTGNNTSFSGSYELTSGAGYIAFSNDNAVGSSSVGINCSGSAGGFYFTTSGNTLASTRTITLIGSCNLFWNGSAGNTNTIASLITGAGSITKQSYETHILSNNNTYTGATYVRGVGSTAGAAEAVLRVSGTLGGTSGQTVDFGNIVFEGNGTNGILEFSTASNLGVCSQVRFRNSGGPAGYGGALRYIGSTVETVTKTIQCDTAIGIRLESNSTGGGSITYSGSFSQTNRGLYVAGTGIGFLSSNFTGTGSVTKRGSGTWTLSGTNTYTGTTDIQAGTLIVTKMVSGPAKVNNATFTNIALTVDFNSGPLVGETYRILPGATTQTYASVTLTGTGVSGRTGTYNSTNSTLTIS